MFVLCVYMWIWKPVSLCVNIYLYLHMPDADIPVGTQPSEDSLMVEGNRFTHKIATGVTTSVYIKWISGFKII